MSLPTPEDPLPLRFATSTPGAIQSGVMYGALATIEDFAQAFQTEVGGGKGKMVLTGKCCGALRVEKESLK